MRKLLFLLALGSCATLNTWGMSERCKDLYNACLNGCPNPGARGNPPATGNDWQINVAECTDRCNKQAKSCK